MYNCICREPANTGHATMTLQHRWWWPDNEVALERRPMSAGDRVLCITQTKRVFYDSEILKWLLMCCVYNHSEHWQTRNACQMMFQCLVLACTCYLVMCKLHAEVHVPCVHDTIMHRTNMS